MITLHNVAVRGHGRILCIANNADRNNFNIYLFYKVIFFIMKQ